MAVDRFHLRRKNGMSVNELNERQWPFFRFLVMAVVHCPIGSKPMIDRLANAAPGTFEQMYKEKLGGILVELAKVRDGYIQDAEEASMKTSEFKTRMLTLEAEKKALVSAQGLDEKEIVKALEQLKKEQRQTANAQARVHLRASLGKIEKPQQAADRILGVANASESTEEDAGDSTQVVQESVELPLPAGENENPA
jgi:predicted RNA-binding protein with RPS1 domain